MSQQNTENLSNQEKIAKEKAENIFSWIRESIGKEEAGWDKKKVMAEMEEMYIKLTKDSRDKAIFDILDSMAKSEKEREYVSFLRIGVIQKIDSTIGDGNYKGIKEHYGFSGAEIIEAVTKKPNANKNNDELRKLYRLTSEDFLVYFTQIKRPKIKIEDIQRYCEQPDGAAENDDSLKIIDNYLKNAGITKEEARQFVEKEKEKTIDDIKKEQEEKRKERLTWAKIAMKGLDTQVMKTIFYEMEKNLQRHPEIQENNYAIYYKAMENAINVVREKQIKKEAEIVEEVNRAVLQSA